MKKLGRVYNFSAGPAVLPEEVLREAQEEMMDYRGCGQSVMEMSHRSKVFDDLINETEEDLRDLMQIPDNYRILYMQGGASLQFAMIPMNLMRHGVADYIITGQWAKKAWQEAQKYGTANAIASLSLIHISLRELQSVFAFCCCTELVRGDYTTFFLKDQITCILFCFHIY